MGEGMKERPILFSGPMVRAIERDWEPKTQSRRTRGLGVINACPIEAWEVAGQGVGAGMRKADYFVIFFNNITGQSVTIRCPYGRPGDQLWVRETWQINHVSLDHGPIPKTRPLEGGEPVDLIYRADGEFREQFEIDEGGSCWRPSIFMPRWASRISLEITAVRVERLQDISEADTKAEGFERAYYRGYTKRKADDPADLTDAWDAMNAKRGHPWESNPWVWAITFRVLP